MFPSVFNVCLSVYLLVLGIEVQILCVLDKCSSTEYTPQPFYLFV
jgi:hypothetical protein